MNFFDYGLLKSFVQTFKCPEPVVEIGSLVVDDGMKGFAGGNLSPEKIFFGTEYKNFVERPL
jgi:hypothetical protein